MIISGTRLVGGTYISVSDNIVTANLLQYLDATNYSGSGATWTAQIGGDATLYNSPTYTGTSPTYFNFSPSSFEYADFADLGDQATWTIESWFRVTAPLFGPENGSCTAVIANLYNDNYLNFSMGTNRYPSSSNICIGYFNGGWANTTGFAPTLNTWYHVVGTFDGATVKQYVNNSMNSQFSSITPSLSGGITRIARRWDSSDTNTLNFFPGDIAVVRVYNVPLTTEQISQNYNAEKSRFGL